MLQTLDADQSIDKTAPSFDDKEVAAKLKDGRTAGSCNFSTELLKTGSKVVIPRFHTVLTAV